MDCAALLAKLEEQTRNCTACGLCRERTHIVFGRGAAAARIMFIGEGPGADEDRQGEPFVGRAGKLLEKIIAAAELPANDIYICNVVKCRPPGNRLPHPEEAAACRTYLREQIRIVRPRIIVCLGALAAQTLISPEIRITRDRGKWVDKGPFLIMPTFHPAALLRDELKKRPVWEDFCAVRDCYRRIISTNSRPE